MLKARLRGSNLYLVGMMGSGKSRTGPVLAKTIGYSFVDSDVVIEQLLGKSIQNIFSEEGEDYFRSVESEVFKSIGERHSLVVATGGGLVLSPKNWGILRQGIVIWLDVKLEKLLERIKKDSSVRPLLENTDPGKALEVLFVKRKKFYSEADVHIKVDNQSPKQVSLEMLDKLSSILKSQEDLTSQQTIE